MENMKIKIDEMGILQQANMLLNVRFESEAARNLIKSMTKRKMLPPTVKCLIQQYFIVRFVYGEL